ncbi:squalene cyclase [Apiospora arundinis]
MDLSLSSRAKEALEKAVQFSFDHQREDGHWVAEVSSDATFTAQYVMFKYSVGLDLKSDGDAIKLWLLNDQKEDGSWGLAPELPGNVSTTTEAYLALKILGVSARKRPC